MLMKMGRKFIFFSPQLLMWSFFPKDVIMLVLEADMVFCTYFSDLFHYPLYPTLQKPKSKCDKISLRPWFTQRNLKCVLLLEFLYGYSALRIYFTWYWRFQSSCCVPRICCDYCRKKGQEWLHLLYPIMGVSHFMDSC